MTTLAEPPLTIAVQIYSYFDQVGMLPLFQINRRWRQIGESEGVSLQLLKCYGLAEVYKSRYAAEKSPKTFLEEDEEFSPLNHGGANKIKLAELSKNISRFLEAADRSTYPLHKFFKTARFGPGLSDRKKQIVDDILENNAFRIPNPFDSMRNRLPFHVSEPIVSESFVEFQTRFGPGGLASTFDAVPVEIRQMIRMFGGSPIQRLFSPFGAVESYQQKDVPEILSLRELLVLGSSPAHSPIGRITPAYFICVAKHDDEFGRKPAPRDDDDRVRDEDDDEDKGSIANNVFVRLKKGTVFAKRIDRTQAVLPLAPDLSTFFKFFADALETKMYRRIPLEKFSACDVFDQCEYNLDKEVDVKEVLLSDHGLTKKKQLQQEDDDDAETSIINGDEILREFKSLPNDEQIRKVRDILKRHPMTYISGFPSYSPTTRNTSRAVTNTIAGNIIVEVSAALLPSRTYASALLQQPSAPSPVRSSTYFFAYQIRIWRELSSEDGSNETDFLPVLKTRHWKIFHSNTAKENNKPDDSVKGPGVIGLYPALLPVSRELAQKESERNKSLVETDEEPIDGIFIYTSGTQVPRPEGGSMEGSFEFGFKRRNENSGWEDDSHIPAVDVQVGNFTTELAKRTEKDQNGNLIDYYYVYCD